MKRWIKGLFAAGLLALTLFTAAMAGPFEEGEAAYQRNDYAAALSYWQPLADQGDANAQFRVGALYAFGLGVPEDRAKSIAWFQKAAEQGNVDAQFVLGVRYRDGEGVPQDYVLSHMWMNLAAARAAEVTPGGIDRSVMVQCRDGVAAKMTPDQIAEAQRMAREWKPK
jgi:hypothetical protein